MSSITEQKSLGHEKHSGASCKKCGPKCEGLDLHFWRKICNNCKCRLEEHQVDIPTKNRVPRKFVRKSIIVDEGGMPELPKQTVVPKEPVKRKETLPEPNVDTLVTSSVTSNTSEFVVCPENLNGQVISLSIKDPAVSNSEVCQTIQDESFPPVPDNVRNSFTFVPDGANEETVSKYLAAIPVDKAPTNEEGYEYHKQQMMQQLPAHDFEESLPDDALTEQEKEKMMHFKRKRDEEDSGQGALKSQTELISAPASCTGCCKNFESGGVVIFANLVGPDKCWHPECFVCETCKEILVDLIYFHHEGNIYCGRHYGEILGIRCAACDELIFSEGYAQAEGLNYHTKHFCCFECDKELAGQQYVPKDGHPYCMDCNETKFSKICHGCKNKIPPPETCYSYEEFFWHNNSTCFCCSVCKISLIGKEFVPKDGVVYCSADCFAKTVTS